MDKALVEKLVAALTEFILGFFKDLEKTEEKPTATNGSILEIIEIPKMPTYKTKGPENAAFQTRLNAIGKYRLTVDGDFGDLTLKSSSDFQKKHGLTGTGKPGNATLGLLGLKVVKENIITQATSWGSILRKYEGKHESDKAFQEYMDSYWAKSGLPNFKGLVGSARAWCGVFVFMGLTVAGYQTPVNSFRAKSWDGYGHAIDFKKDGIPKDAIIRVNSKGDCKSASNNHVTTANGYCAAATLNKAGATIGAFGGNQSDKAKVSIYKVSTVCYVGWPNKTAVGTPVEKPAKVLKDNNCTGTGSTNESTR